MDRRGVSDHGLYGIEFARSATLLVRYHGDEPEVVRLGLGLDNLMSRGRDTFLEGINASAKGHEAKGLARLGWAQYLQRKAQFAKNSRKGEGRRKMRFQSYDEEGKLVWIERDEPDEEYAYRLHLRLCDPEALRTEAERLFEEVIAEYADVPCVTRAMRNAEARLAALKGDDPKTLQEREALERALARKRTCGEVAAARLDEMHHVAVGQPAPEIDGVDMEGKPLKLSDYRGKVVALVFWGSWCGPCLREIPHEHELAERLKDRPFALLGIDCDEDRAAGLKAIREHKISWPNWNDGAPGEGPIVERYHVRAYPSILVIDAKGIIRHKGALGPSLDEAVETLLKEIEATP
jgi:thiol-disulfide isomerase/thioredoxin